MSTNRDDVRDALLESIKKQAETIGQHAPPTVPAQLLSLARAFALVAEPSAREASN